MVAALVAALEEDLSDYYRLIAVLEAQLGAQHSLLLGGGNHFSSAASQSSASSSSSSSSSSAYSVAPSAVLGGSSGLTLRRLAVWACDPAERLHLMAVICGAVGTRLRGGALASCLDAHLRHGDPLVQ